MMGMTLSIGVDCKKRDPLSCLQERHGIVDGASRLAAAIPSHEDMPADIVERASYGHHRIGFPASTTTFCGSEKAASVGGFSVSDWPRRRRSAKSAPARPTAAPSVVERIGFGHDVQAGKARAEASASARGLGEGAQRM